VGVGFFILKRIERCLPREFTNIFYSSGGEKGAQSDESATEQDLHIVRRLDDIRSAERFQRRVLEMRHLCADEPTDKIRTQSGG
jgi:hypothetical protein